MSIRSVTDHTFAREVLAATKPILVDFGATWCPPCRVQEPLLEELASERPDLDIVKVNVEEAPKTAATYSVRGLPTLILFRGGEATATAVGLQRPASLRALLDN